MSTLEKKEYSFYKDYVHSGSRQKMMLITLLQGAEQPWCFKYYLELLKDHDGAIRSDAAKGISDLGSGIDAKKLMSEIDRLNAVVGNERILGMANLVLAIGNSKDPSLLESLLLHYSKEIDPALREAYQKATAKLGFKKSIREIEIQLLSGDGYQKNDALVKVLYINSPEWVGTLVPLLIDEEVGVSMPWGSGS